MPNVTNLADEHYDVMRTRFPFKDTSLASRRSGLAHHIAGCETCDWSAHSRNVIGLAAQHAYRTGHSAWAETGHAYSWNMPDE